MKKNQPFDHVAEYMNQLMIETTQIDFAGRISNKPIRNAVPWNLKKHSHHSLELLFFLDGQAEILYSGDRMHTHTYHLLVYPQGLVHQEVPDFHHPLDVICVLADIKSLSTLKVPFQLTDKTGEFRWLFEHIEKEWTMEKGIGSRLSEHYLKAIITLIQRYFTNYEPRTHEIVGYCIQYMRTHFTEEINMEHLCALLHVSPSYLTRLFKKYTGIAPMHYLNDFRVHKAKDLLIRTNLPLRSVASGIGIQDALYFSRLFRKMVGMSPSTFRNLSNEG